MLNLQANALRSLRISLRGQINEGDVWEAFSLAHKDVSMTKMSKIVSQSRPSSIYKAPKALIVVAPLNVLSRL